MVEIANWKKHDIFPRVNKRFDHLNVRKWRSTKVPIFAVNSRSFKGLPSADLEFSWLLSRSRSLQRFVTISNWPQACANRTAKMPQSATVMTQDMLADNNWPYKKTSWPGLRSTSAIPRQTGFATGIINEVDLTSLTFSPNHNKPTV